MSDVLTTEEQLKDKHRQAMDACNWYRKQDRVKWKWVYDLAMALEDCIDALRKERASHLSIAEIAAQRTAQTGVKVTPREVFVEEIEKYGFEQSYSGISKSIDATWYTKKTERGFIVSESRSSHGSLYYVSGGVQFRDLPYTAITPALIKAVCGGGE